MNKVEQVARAICPDWWDEGGRAMRQARAAIEAMREPEPSDAEVWSCPCCGQIVDRALMKKAAKEEADE